LGSGVVLEAMETPGHTQGCVSWVLSEDGKPLRLFSGDTLWHGGAGRVDLHAHEGVPAEAQAAALHQSFTKLKSLPDDVVVHPAHGGVAPSGKGGKKGASTIGEEKEGNKMFQCASAEDLIRIITKGQPLLPSYYTTCLRVNKQGPPPLARAAAAVPLMAPEAFATALKNSATDPGTLFVDTREAPEFHQEFLLGSVNIPMGTNDGLHELSAELESHEGMFNLWLGRIAPADVRLYVITDPGRERDAFLRLARAGLDTNVRGVLDGGFPSAPKSAARVSHDRVKASELVKAQEDGAVVLDVREVGEFTHPKAGHLKGAYNIPFPKLRGAIPQLKAQFPGKKFVVYCAGGFRSTTAAAMLHAHGVTATDVDGGYALIKKELSEEQKAFDMDLKIEA